jgi:hypothetical protein
MPTLRLTVSSVLVNSAIDSISFGCSGIMDGLLELPPWVLLFEHSRQVKVGTGRDSNVINGSYSM